MSNAKTFIEELQRQAMIANEVNIKLHRQLCYARLVNLRSPSPMILSVSADDKEIWSHDKDASETATYDGEQVSKLGLYKRLGKQYLDEDLSDYEDPYQYIRLRLVEDEIRQAAKDLGHAVPAYPRIGTIMSATFNAEVWALPGTYQRIVLFNYGILYFYEALIRCCVRLLKWKKVFQGGSGTYEIDQQHALEVIESEGVVVEFFQDVLTEVLEGELDFSKWPSFPKPEAHMTGLDSGLRNAIWLFLMGHEYGHLIHGDLDSRDQSEEISVKWMKEYMADARGFELMNQVVGEKYPIDFTHRVIAAALCFAGIDLIYRSVSYILDSPYPSADSSHPPPIERWQHLSKVIYQNSEDKELSLSAFGFGSAMADIVEVLFAYSDSVHEKLRRTPDKIASGWANS